MTDQETLTHKYTGTQVVFDNLALVADPLARLLADAIWRAAALLASTEADLVQLAGTITAATRRVTDAITAAAGQTTATVNPIGELQSNGPRFDLLVAVREERITQLRQLVRLWSTHRAVPQQTESTDSTGAHK